MMAVTTVEAHNCTPYNDGSDSDGDYVCPPQCNSDKILTISQQQSINLRLEGFIQALPHLEPIHYAVHLGKEKNSKKCCFCSCASCLTPWRQAFQINFDEELCKNTLYTSNGILQHSEAKSDEYHQPTAFYFQKLSSTVLPLRNFNAQGQEKVFGDRVGGGG
jgi:hypothetical protein